MGAEPFEITVDGRERVLIIGHTWCISGSDWHSVRRAGYSAIICPRLKDRRRGVSGPGRVSIDEHVPDYVYPLERVGGLRITIYDDRSRSATITPLD